MRTRTFLAALTILPIVLHGGCKKFGVSVTDPFVSFSTATGEQEVGPEITGLDVQSQTGTIEIVGGTETNIRVDATVKIRESRLDNGSAPEPGEFGDHVRVAISEGKVTVSDAHMTDDDTSDWRVALVIHVPARLAVAASITAGGIVVRGMHSDLDLKSEAGEITVTAGAMGGLKANTTAGNIDLSVGSVSGPVDAKVGAGNLTLRVSESPPAKNVRLASSAGNVTLALPKDSPGVYKAEATVGDVQVSGQGGLAAKRSGLGSTADGTVGEGGPTYELEAAVGTITIR